MAAPLPFGDQIYIRYCDASPPQGWLQWSDATQNWTDVGWVATLLDANDLRIIYTDGNNVAHYYDYVFAGLDPLGSGADFWNLKQAFDVGADNLRRPTTVPIGNWSSSTSNTSVTYTQVPPRFGVSMSAIWSLGSIVLPWNPGYIAWNQLQVPNQDFLNIAVDSLLTYTNVIFSYSRGLAPFDIINTQFNVQADGSWALFNITLNGTPVPSSPYAITEWSSGNFNYPDPDLTSPAFSAANGFSRANGHRSRYGFTKANGF